MVTIVRPPGQPLWGSADYARFRFVRTLAMTDKTRLKTALEGGTFAVAPGGKL
jgi:hypothetical protein